MRAYYRSGLMNPIHIAVMVLSGIAMLGSPMTSKAQTPAAATPSAVKGTVSSCPKKLQKDKDIHDCQIVNGSVDQSALVDKALDVLSKVVKSDEFKAAVLAANFDPTQLKQCKSKDSCGPQLTNDKVYELMVSNSPQKINVTYYLHRWPDEGNQGFEDPVPPDTVYGNAGKIKKDEGFLASLMLHEWMHILGFRHDNSSTTCRSVPYEMNLVYQKIAALRHLAPALSPCRPQDQ